MPASTWLSHSFIRTSKTSSQAQVDKSFFSSNATPNRSISFNVGTGIAFTSVELTCVEPFRIL